MKQTKTVLSFAVFTFMCGVLFPGNASALISGAEILNETITGAHILNGSIGSIDITDNSIQSVDVLNETLTTLDIKDDSILSRDIQNDTIISADIKNDTLTSSDIKDNGILSVDIQDNTITTLDVKDGTIGLVDLSVGVSSLLNGFTSNITALQLLLQQHTTSLSGHDTSLAQILSDISSLQLSVASAHSRIDSLETDLDFVRNNPKEIWVYTATDTKLGILVDEDEATDGRAIVKYFDTGTNRIKQKNKFGSTPVHTINSYFTSIDCSGTPGVINPADISAPYPFTTQDFVVRLGDGTQWYNDQTTTVEAEGTFLSKLDLNGDCINISETAPFKLFIALSNSQFSGDYPLHYNYSDGTL